jgi:PleD family two-component response regulator
VLTISVGVAELDPALDKTPADWLERADLALYDAKKARNKVVSTRPGAHESGTSDSAEL